MLLWLKKKYEAQGEKLWGPLSGTWAYTVVWGSGVNLLPSWDVCCQVAWSSSQFCRPEEANEDGISYFLNAFSSGLHFGLVCEMPTWCPSNWEDAVCHGILWSIVTMLGGLDERTLSYQLVLLFTSRGFCDKKVSHTLFQCVQTKISDANRIYKKK